MMILLSIPLYDSYLFTYRIIILLLDEGYKSLTLKGSVFFIKQDNVAPSRTMLLLISAPPGASALLLGQNFGHLALSSFV